tara:strand:- start:173 stop:982 length:810 start_codon:yes stop_codon:yes gene_type:complete
MNRVNQLRDIQYEALSLFEKKNADYGDAFATYGTVGVLVRIGDKLGRYTSINKSGITLVDNEALRDTLIDLHNYSAMAIMLIDENERKYSNAVVDEIARSTSSIVDMRRLIDKGTPIELFKHAGCEASQLRCYGVTAKELKQGGYEAKQLKEAGFTLFEMQHAGCYPSELRQLNICNEQLYNTGYTIEELYDTSVEKKTEDEFVDEVYTKKFHDLRKYYDDDMVSCEGGNRTGIADDTDKAKAYASEARKLYKLHMSNQKKTVLAGYEC